MFRKALNAATVTILSIAGSYIAMAQTVTKDTIMVEMAWSRETPTGARVAGGFMKITNTGTEPDRLVGGSFVNSKRVEIHEMAMDGGNMKMRELANGLEIKPGATVELKPGSFHVMFMELEKHAKTGDTVKGTLVFAKAGTIEVSYAIAPLGAMTPDGKGGKAPGAGHHGAMKH